MRHRNQVVKDFARVKLSAQLGYPKEKLRGLSDYCTGAVRLIPSRGSPLPHLPQPVAGPTFRGVLRQVSTQSRHSGNAISAELAGLVAAILARDARLRLGWPALERFGRPFRAVAIPVPDL